MGTINDINPYYIEVEQLSFFGSLMSYEEEDKGLSSALSDTVFEIQSSIIAENILLNGNVDFFKCDSFKVEKDNSLQIKDNFIWPNKGEIIAGGYLIHERDRYITYSDIDIYFKSKTNALEFLELNSIEFSTDLSKNEHSFKTSFKTPRNSKAELNIIYGVDFNDKEDLIKKFDFRCCAIAYCPNNDEITYAIGALTDISYKRLIFNPYCSNTTLSRLLKYKDKGFDIDKSQINLFVDFIKSEKYNSSLEFAKTSL
jgi:hypothetical protein